MVEQGANHSHTGELATRVAVTERELDGMYTVLQRIEAAVSKISEMNASVKEMLAVHENRLQTQGKQIDTVFDILERNKDTLVGHIEKMNQKVETAVSSLERQLISKIDTLDKDFSDRVDAIEGEFVKRLDRVTLNTQTQFNRVERDFNKKAETLQPKTDADNLEKRVTTLETWRWILLGGGAVIGFVIGHFANLAAIFGK